MVYMRGSSEDFNRFGSVTGDSGWNWASMQQYVKKVCDWFPPHMPSLLRIVIHQNERLVAPADGHRTTGQFNPILHGTSGNVQVSLPGFATPLDNRVMATLKELPSEFPFLRDASGGDVLGIGKSVLHGLSSCYLMCQSGPSQAGHFQVSAVVRGVVPRRPTWHPQSAVRISTFLSMLK